MALHLTRETRKNAHPESGLKLHADPTRDIRPSDYHCNARTRQEGAKPYCSLRAGWGTQHAGTGRCKLHGGCAPTGITHPQFKSGRYSRIQSGRLKDLIEEHRKAPEPLELMDEIALLRALAHDTLERWESIFGENGALMHWHESWLVGEHAKKPRQLPDIASVSLIVERIGLMVERVHKMKSEHSLTADQVKHVMTQFGVETAKALAQAGLTNEQEQRIITSIEARWQHIQLQPAK